MQKSLFFNIIKFFAIFFCFFVFANAKVLGTIAPFATGFFLALVWCNQKIVWLAPMYVISQLLTNFSVATAISSIGLVLIIFIICLIHTKTKKQINFNLFIFYALLSQSAYIFSNIYFFNEFIFTFLTVLSSVFFMIVCKIIFKPFFLQENVGNLSLTEKICALAFLCTLSCGLTCLKIFGVPLLQIFAPLIILFFATTKKVSSTVLVASVLGLGGVISEGDGLFMAPLVLMAISSCVVGGAHKIVPCLVLIATDALCGFFLNLYETYSTIHLVFSSIGAIIFFAIPKNTIQKINALFQPVEDFGLRSVVNRSRENLCKRFNELGNVFGEMDFVFRNMIKGGMTKQQAKAFLIDEVKDKVCSDCPERNICHRKCFEETSSVLDGLVSRALEKGKATLLDAPSYLTTRCGRVGNLVGAVNNLCGQYTKYASVMNNIDASKVLMADELKGLSKIMKSLANEVNTNITFNNQRENQIISELAFHSLLCADAVIYEENLTTVSVTLLMRKTDCKNPKIEQVVSHVCKTPMSICDIQTSARAGWNTITLNTSPKLALAYGTASIAKDGSKISGDTYSIIKISHNKFLLALCDGMGSGEKAEKTSSLAIGLVENFYKAGFDNEIILSSINKLLSLNNEDIFSALDVCVIDTQNSTCDFIKMGAPESFIKHPSTISKISGGTLPLGIVDAVQPVIKKQILDSGDYVFMFTDGISDSFSTAENLQDFVNNLQSTNPQTLAESLLAKALELSSGARDDMSVIVAKIFDNNISKKY